MEKIVADTGPLLALGIINRLDLLAKLYVTICISSEVKREIEVGAVKYEDAKNVLAALERGWLTEASIEQTFRGIVKKLVTGTPKLGKAQAESIVLCKQLSINLLLVDDKDANKIAQRHGIQTVHGLDIIVESTKVGLITPSKALDHINQFREAGEYSEKDLREAEGKIKVFKGELK